jgi:hypothetical protein
MPRLKLFAKISFCLFVTSVVFTSCNGDEKKTDEANQSPKTDTISNIGKINADTTIADCEYYITENDGKNMIDTFLAIYPRLANSASHKLTNSFWIDSCELSSLIDFFSTTGADCDGVRFCFINDRNAGLAIIPTVKSATPSETSRHTDRPDLKIMDKCRGGSKYFNIADHPNKMNTFGSKFRQETTAGDRKSAKLDSLSAGVWYSRCVILKLARLVTDRANNLNGITAFCAAHLKMEASASKLGQLYPKQSSLIFVPTYGASHIPNWDIVMPPPAIAKSAYETKSGAFNHGELCPKVCD